MLGRSSRLVFSFVFRIKRRKLLLGVVILLLAASVWIIISGNGNGKTSLYTSEEIVEEVSVESYFQSKVSELHSSFAGAVLFLGGLDSQVTSFSKEGTLGEASGGPYDDGISPELQTVSDVSLVATTPVLTIVPAGSTLTKEALTFTYEIENGDTLSDIAEGFGVSLETLLWANNMSSRSVIRPGDRLTILPVDGVTHTVKSGDTIESIAQKYKASPEEVLAYNSLTRSDIIKVGDVLVVPGGTPHVPVSTNTAPNAPVYTLVDAGGYFSSPAQGRLTYGLHPYNAVDIGGSNYCNTSVYASASGTVITADGVGWNGGYGKYIKISHPNGTVTLYAHASQLLVSKGDYVTKGQVIALMGATGNATGCHVHFEVRGALNPFAQY